jgi:hypothetical protein
MNETVNVKREDTSADRPCLGDQYKDQVTGFEGECTADAVYLYSESMFEITSKKLRADGKPISEWFPQKRLERVGAE